LHVCVWSWVAAAGVLLQSAVAGFIFPPCFQAQKGLGGYALSLVLASFWLRFFLLMLWHIALLIFAGVFKGKSAC